jgi:hypothetical protein
MLPEYSAELLAANYPNRQDQRILSGPYTPAYLAKAEINRLRAALDDAFSILHIALPCPRPWPTEGDESKLRIFRNIAEDRAREALSSVSETSPVSVTGGTK